MEFDIEKEQEEIRYLNALADEDIKQHKELHNKMQINITKLKVLFDMR